jgi:hypothetical protein
LTHHHKVKGSTLAAATSTEIEKWSNYVIFLWLVTLSRYFLLARGGSLMVEHFTHHPKVKSSNLAAATGTEIEKRSNYVIFLWLLPLSRYLFLTRGGSLTVEHLTHHPKVKGSSLVVAIGTDRENDKIYLIIFWLVTLSRYFLLARGGNLMVEHLTHHLKVKGSILAAAATDTRREKIINSIPFSR